MAFRAIFLYLIDSEAGSYIFKKTLSKGNPTKSWRTAKTLGELYISGGEYLIKVSKIIMKLIEPITDSKKVL